MAIAVSHLEREKMWELEKIEINKMVKTKLTPLPVDPLELYCTPIMFARFVCALLSFSAHDLPAKYEI